MAASVDNSRQSQRWSTLRRFGAVTSSASHSPTLSSKKSKQRGLRPSSGPGRTEERPADAQHKDGRGVDDEDDESDESDELIWDKNDTHFMDEASRPSSSSSRTAFYALPETSSLPHLNPSSASQRTGSLTDLHLVSPSPDVGFVPSHSPAGSNPSFASVGSLGGRSSNRNSIVANLEELAPVGADSMHGVSSGVLRGRSSSSSLQHGEQLHSRTVSSASSSSFSGSVPGRFSSSSQFRPGTSSSAGAHALPTGERPASVSTSETSLSTLARSPGAKASSDLNNGRRGGGGNGGVIHGSLESREGDAPAPPPKQAASGRPLARPQYTSGANGTQDRHRPADLCLTGRPRLLPGEPSPRRAERSSNVSQRPATSPASASHARAGRSPLKAAPTPLSKAEPTSLPPPRTPPFRRVDSASGPVTPSKVLGPSTDSAASHSSPAPSSAAAVSSKRPYNEQGGAKSPESLDSSPVCRTNNTGPLSPAIQPRSSAGSGMSERLHRISFLPGGRPRPSTADSSSSRRKDRRLTANQGLAAVAAPVKSWRKVTSWRGKGAGAEERPEAPVEGDRPDVIIGRPIVEKEHESSAISRHPSSVDGEDAQSTAAVDEEEDTTSTSKPDPDPVLPLHPLKLETSDFGSLDFSLMFDDPNWTPATTGGGGGGGSADTGSSKVQLLGPTSPMSFSTSSTSPGGSFLAPLSFSSRSASRPASDTSEEPHKDVDLQGKLGPSSFVYQKPHSSSFITDVSQPSQPTPPSPTAPESWTPLLNGFEASLDLTLNRPGQPERVPNEPPRLTLSELDSTVVDSSLFSGPMASAAKPPLPPGASSKGPMIPPAPAPSFAPLRSEMSRIRSGSDLSAMSVATSGSGGKSMAFIDRRRGDNSADVHTDYPPSNDSLDSLSASQLPNSIGSPVVGGPGGSMRPFRRGSAHVGFGASTGVDVVLLARRDRSGSSSSRRLTMESASGDGPRPPAAASKGEAAAQRRVEVLPEVGESEVQEELPSPESGVFEKGEVSPNAKEHVREDDDVGLHTTSSSKRSSTASRRSDGVGMSLREAERGELTTKSAASASAASPSPFSVASSRRPSMDSFKSAISSVSLGSSAGSPPRLGGLRSAMGGSTGSLNFVPRGNETTVGHAGRGSSSADDMAPGRFSTSSEPFERGRVGFGAGAGAAVGVGVGVASAQEQNPRRANSNNDLYGARSKAAVIRSSPQKVLGGGSSERSQGMGSIEVIGRSPGGIVGHAATLPRRIGGGGGGGVAGRAKRRAASSVERSTTGDDDVPSIKHAFGPGRSFARAGATASAASIRASTIFQAVDVLGCKTSGAVIDGARAPPPPLVLGGEAEMEGQSCGARGARSSPGASPSPSRRSPRTPPVLTYSPQRRPSNPPLPPRPKSVLPAVERAEALRAFEASGEGAGAEAEEVILGGGERGEGEEEREEGLEAVVEGGRADAVAGAGQGVPGTVGEGEVDGGAGLGPSVPSSPGASQNGGRSSLSSSRSARSLRSLSARERPSSRASASSNYAYI